ncbi:MAG TPA: YezD family protein [Candidatus Acidoferrum sp.]|nr:YezD family protein [Candidatus Acidoferrum sp.]
MSESRLKPVANDSGDSKWLEIVRQQVGSLRYGVVEIVVHDSRVTQIEKTERVRLDKSHPKSP